jgi:hypothetical protein
VVHVVREVLRDLPRGIAPDPGQAQHLALGHPDRDEYGSIRRTSGPQRDVLVACRAGSPNATYVRSASRRRCRCPRRAARTSPDRGADARRSQVAGVRSPEATAAATARVVPRIERLHDADHHRPAANMSSSGRTMPGRPTRGYACRRAPRRRADSPSGGHRAYEAGPR